MSSDYFALLLDWDTFIRPRPYLSASTAAFFLVILRRRRR